MSKDTQKALLTLVDKSTRALVSADTALTKANEELVKTNNELVKLVVATATDLEFKQSELAGVEQDVKNRIREGKVEFDLAIRENEDKVISDVLKRHNKVAVDKAEFESIVEAGNATELAIETRITQATDELRSKLSAEFAAKVNTIESNHRVNTAETNAALVAANAKVVMLEEQLTKSEAALEAERNARISIAESESKRQAVTVNTAK